jgi:hypothetical protein
LKFTVQVAELEEAVEVAMAAFSILKAVVEPEVVATPL